MDSAGDHLALHFDCTAYGADNTRELYQQAVSGRLDDATVVFPDLRITDPRRRRGPRRLTRWSGQGSATVGSDEATTESWVRKPNVVRGRHPSALAVGLGEGRVPNRHRPLCWGAGSCPSLSWRVSVSCRTLAAPPSIARSTLLPTAAHYSLLWRTPRPV